MATDRSREHYTLGRILRPCYQLPARTGAPPAAKLEKEAPCLSAKIATGLPDVYSAHRDIGRLL
eukprot:10471101-Prorocentrum_lima.AAC.1